MANEITVTTNLRCKNGYYDQAQNIVNYQKTQTGTHMSSDIIAVNTVGETLEIAPDITTCGYALFRNIGANTISITVDIKLEGGDVALFIPNSTSITATSFGGDSELYYWINED